MSDKVKQYSGDEVDVTWDGRLCIHIGECGRAAGDLFEAGRDPWCAPNTGSAAEAIDVCQRCPTGALAFSAKDKTLAERPAAENRVVVANNGPFYIQGDLDIDGAAPDMPGVAFRAALCRCGKSSQKPFCDNAHEKSGFQDRGAVGQTGDPDTVCTGKLTVKRAPNGPLLLRGNCAIVASSGRVAWRGNKVALCRCGESKNKPFCDGAHSKAGFQAE